MPTKYLLKLTDLRNFLRFWWQAKSVYQIHSPFLYVLVKYMFRKPKDIPFNKEITAERKRLSHDRTEIIGMDPGAGSRVNRSKTIREIARTSVSPEYKCRILHQISQFIQADKILELGTSLGFSSIALASANPDSKLFTVEGNSTIADLAREMHQRIGIENIEVIKGNFNDLIPELIRKQGPFDLFYLDGDHRKESTIYWTKVMVRNLNKRGAFILDDIYWSSEMMEAWEICRNMPGITASVDLYIMGILFINPDIKQDIHLKTIPAWMKPTQAGIFYQHNRG